MYHILLGTGLVSVGGSVSACVGDSGPTPQRANDKGILFSFFHFHTHVSEKSSPFGILGFPAGLWDNAPLPVGNRESIRGGSQEPGIFTAGYGPPPSRPRVPQREVT